MNINPRLTALKNFFDSNAIKNIFDNVRNLALSTVVLIAGFYLAHDAINYVKIPIVVLILGYFLIGIGFGLLLLNVLHVYHHLIKRKSNLPKMVTLLIFAIYSIISVQLFFAVLWSKGIYLV